MKWPDSKSGSFGTETKNRVSSFIMAAGGGSHMLVGTLGEFCPEKETVDQYKERFELYCLANAINVRGEDGNERNQELAKKKAILLTEIGVNVYHTLSDLVSPDKPNNKTIEAIFGTLKKHYNPTPLEMAETIRFWSRLQKDGETIAQYSRALRQLSIHCNFGQFLERALRDRFCTGLNSKNSNIKKKFGNMKAEDVTFENAVRIASTMEMVEKEFVGEPQSTATVNKMQASKGKVGGASGRGNHTNRGGKGNASHNDRPSREKCWRCHGKHSPHICKFKDEKCFICSKSGHISIACNKKKQRNVKEISEDHDESDYLDLFHVRSVGSKKKGGIMVPITIEGQEIVMQLDTAADVSLITRDMYEKHFKHVDVEPSDMLFMHITMSRYLKLGKSTWM